MLNLSERHLIRLEGGGAHSCAGDVAVVASAVRDELGKRAADGGLWSVGSFHVVPEVIDDLGVEGLGAGYPSSLGLEVCVFDIGAELGELDVDLIAPHRLDLVAYPLLGLVPMVGAQNSVSCGEFELASPALCDADVDGRLTVG